MKISLRKRIIAFMLSVILLFSGSISGFASELLESDPMAEAAAAVVSEEATEPATEAATEEVTEAATEAVTEEATEAAAKEETVEETEEEIVEETETETVEETEEETEESEEETEEESEEETQVLEYEDDDVKIHVSEKAKGAIPKDASLKVTPITECDKEYNEVEKQLNEKAEGEEYEIAGFLAYDITFIDKNENKVEPNGEVAVSMEYKKAVTPVTVKKEETENTDVTVMHLEENSRGEIKEVVDMVADATQEAEVTTTADVEVEKAVFVTDSFSVFTITWIRKDGETEVFKLTEDIKVLVVDGTNYAPMVIDDVQVLAELTVSSDGTPPTLFADSIAVGGKNEALYNVEANKHTYQFVKMIHAKTDKNGTIQAVHLEPVVAIQAAEKENGNEYLRYMIEGMGVYRDASELPEDEFLAFVYMDGDSTTLGFYYSEDGQKISDDTYDFSRLANEADNEEGIPVVIETPPGALKKIGNYEYRYIAIEQLGKRILPTYLRYHTEVIDGVETSNLQYRVADSNTGEQAEWVDVVDADIRLIYKTSDTITTANTAGIVDIDLFNYNITGSTENGNPGGKIQGLFFGTGWESSDSKVYNLWTGGVKDSDGKLYSNLAVQGIVKNELVNGYPATADLIDGGGSLETLFDHSNKAGVYSKETHVGLNHLFKIQNGYYVYDSGENYAYFNNKVPGNKNFTIYDSPITKIMPSEDSQKNMTAEQIEAAAKRGDFMPFVAKNESVHSNSNNENAYHMGMTIGFDFIQPEGGKINGEDMIFKFSGDDDVWVFVDGKLVLDIGGLHNEASGQINFTTGEVVVQSGPVVHGVDNKYGPGRNLIIQIAGNETREAAEIKSSVIFLKKIFGLSGNTFEANSSHRLEFFYLERGADVTNCAVTFNLQPIKANDIEVEKEIVNTDKAKYGDVEFSYQLYLEDEVGSGKEDGQGYDLIPEGTKYTLKRDGKVVGTRTVGAKGIFKLKHGESAVFEGINESLKYYVKELSVSDDRFDAVLVNEKAAQYFDENGKSVNIERNETDTDPVGYIAQSDKVTVKDVHKVLFQNTCAESNKRELHIKKLFNGDLYLLDKNARFSFKVMLEDRDGNMVPYVNGQYFVVTDGVTGEVKGYTAADGIISGIKVNQTVIIREIMSGTDFYVEEVDLGEKYQEPKKEVINEGDFAYGNSDKVDENKKPIADGVIVVNKDAKVEITNALKFDWKLVKTSSSKGDKGETLYLTGAEFKLESEDGKTVYTGTSEADGTVLWKSGETNVLAKDIKAGTYKLTETKAPAGYSVPAKEWAVVIDQTSISIKDGSNELAVASANKDGTVSYTITITNEPIYELPSTGGFGIYWYMIAGTVMMMAAAAVTYKNRRKEVLERYR